MPIVTLNKTTLFYREVGTGEPCVVLHGGLGLDHHYMTLLDPLGDQLRLIYVDLRGCGRSGRPALDTISLASLCADVDALRQHLGLARWSVLGNSYGGFVALEYALRYPAHLLHMIVSDTAPSWGDFDDEIAAEIQRHQPGPATRAALTAEPTDDESFGRMFLDLLPLYYSVVGYDEQQARNQFEGTIYCAATATRSLAVAQETYNVTLRLGEITAPALIIVGREDFICPISRAEILHAGLCDAELVIFEHSGHFPFAEEPDAFFAAVRGWLARHPIVVNAQHSPPPSP